MPPTLPNKIQLRNVRLYTRVHVEKTALVKLRAEVERAMSLIGDQWTPVKEHSNSITPHQPRKRQDDRDPHGLPSKIVRKL